ncbi:CHAP domain [Trypanosoma melophagium]|uniref:CHAP domain n=1 Tax=Trypanosoma melophagium TaxID=715481 RepID=UPI003519F557|nr:CHAP domain [Trypanosoma melophagium]
MPVNDTESCVHREDEIVPFGKVLGVTDNGVPVFSNGERSFASRQLSVAPSVRRFGLPHSTFTTGMYDTLGYKWHSVEFVRRYLAMTKGLWLSSVPTVEDVWHIKDPVTSIPDGNSVTVTRHVNGDTTTLPSVGDIMVWGRSSSMPAGHVGIVTYISDNWVRLAEQNYGFNRWPSGKNYSRQIERKIRGDNIVEYHDEESLLGWIKVEAPPYDFSRGDLPDRYRHILSSGHIVRYHLRREVKLPWTNPTERCDFFLKRSLTIDRNMGENACASENDVPDGYYLMDYDIWCRFRFAVNTLHEIAMEATRRILTDPDSEHILVHYFGVPKELHQQLRRSFDTIPPMGGRFDFGYNGKDIIMLEYNCDSSAAMLECGDTQDKMARHYGINSGISTGSFLFSKMVNYFKCLLQNDFVCPPHKLVHFMIDDNDEERYTALYAMNAAEEAGFRTKLCVKLTDFRFAGSATDGEYLIVSRDHPVIVDLEDEKVLLVWKTWAWDTILHQYSEQQSQEPTELNQKPSLSGILLNDNIRVLEPLWKTLTGSKAILPFMYSLAPNHPNMVPASFQLTKEIISGHYLSKPINGRAGQNIIMYDPEDDKDTVAAAPQTVEAPVLCRSLSFPLLEDAPSSAFGTPVDEENENSTGRFFASSVIYQGRVFLKKYEHKYFPIFCGWTIGGEFGGVVVREDTSKITKLASLVVPARVVREHVPLPPAQNSDEAGET